MSSFNLFPFSPVHSSSFLTGAPRLLGRTLLGSLLAANLVACVVESEPGPSGDETPVEVTGATLTKELRAQVQTEWGGMTATTKATDKVGGAEVPLGLLKDCAADQDPEFDADVDSAMVDLETAMDDLLAFVLDDMLQDQWIESETDTEVVYLLDPVSFCDGDEWCEDDLTETPVRASASKTADGTYVVEVLVGTEESRVATVRLNDGLIDITADLADFLNFLRRTIDAADREDLPERLLGKVSVRLQRDGDGRATFSFAIPEALSMDLNTDDGPILVRVAAAENAFSLALDSEADTVEASMDVGAIDVTTPGNVLCNTGVSSVGPADPGDPNGGVEIIEESGCGPEEQDGVLDWHLSGASASVLSSAQAADSWTVSGIGLGADTTYWNLNDQSLVAYDLNANEGRKVSITLTEEADSTLVSFEPALNMQLAMQLNRLSDELKVDLPSWLMDEVFDVTFGGPAKKSVRIPKVADCGGSGAEQVEVAEGSLMLNATSLANPINIEAGMCLVEADPDAEHPFEVIGAGACQ